MKLNLNDNCSDIENIEFGDRVEVQLTDGEIVRGKFVYKNINRTRIELLLDSSGSYMDISVENIQKITVIDHEINPCMEPNKNSDNFCYKAGLVLGAVFIGCIMAIVVALTAKFIFWLF